MSPAVKLVLIYLGVMLLAGVIAKLANRRRP